MELPNIIDEGLWNDIDCLQIEKELAYGGHTIADRTTDAPAKPPRSPQNDIQFLQKE